MVVRDEVHRLVDQLTESELQTAERYLAYLRSGAHDPVAWAFANAPEEDEPITEDEEMAVEEAREDRRQGRVYSAEAAKRMPHRRTRRPPPTPHPQFAVEHDTQTSLPSESLSGR